SFGLGAFRHSVARPVSHAAQRPQCASVERTTASPSFTAVTPGPTASTIPAPSCPRTTGVGYGIEPSITLRSERQSPAARPAPRAAPHVAHELLPAARGPCGVEDEDVGVVAAGEEAARLEARHHRGEMRDAPDAVLERYELPVEHPRAEVVRRPLRTVVAV